MQALGHSFQPPETAPSGLAYRCSPTRAGYLRLWVASAPSQSLVGGKVCQRPFLGGQPSLTADSSYCRRFDALSGPTSSVGRIVRFSPSMKTIARTFIRTSVSKVDIEM